MSAGRPPGRPRVEVAPLGEAAITAAGLALLDDGGEAAVTLRGVARRLGVTPMSVSHHTGGRDGLLARVVAAAHAGLDVPSGDGKADPAEVAATVLAYAAVARRHPAAVAALFAHPDLMPEGLRRFSDWVRHQVALRDPAMAERGLAMLVDYVHGHLLAASAVSEGRDMEQALRANVEQLARWLLAE